MPARWAQLSSAFIIHHADVSRVGESTQRKLANTPSKDLKKFGRESWFTSTPLDLENSELPGRSY